MKKYKLVSLILFTLIVGTTHSQTTNGINIFPNPFGQLADIQFDVEQSDTITLKVFDLQGRLVRTFFEAILFPSGSYTVKALGDNLGNGIYMVQLSYGTKKNMIQKVIKNSPTTIIADSPATIVANNPATVIAASPFNKSITIYPNPTSDIINILIDGNKTILITDRAGLLFKTITTEQNVISLKDLASGAYIITVLNEEKIILLEQKIVKL